MKKAILVIVAVFALVAISCDFETPVRPVDGAAVNAQAAREQAAQSSQIQANVTRYPEREVVAKWHETFSRTPQTYVYLWVPGTTQPFGYYVVLGKPVSTQSYLNPSMTQKREGMGESTHVIETENPDTDGTYGDNNPGIRFFTASGVAVEFGGLITYLYTDKLLPFTVPKLGE